MLFSIIVPVYNVEKYLVRCIESVINQIFKDFECILIDDGSLDNSGNICDEYSLKDSRIVVVHQNNAGVSAARNTGLNIAKGEYICFCDSDDWLEDSLLEQLSFYCQKYTSEIFIYGFANVGAGKKRIYVYDTSATTAEIRDKVLSYEWTCAVWNKCFKKSFINSKRFPEGVLYEDVAFIPQLVYQAESIKVIPKCLYNYDIDIQGSITKIQKSNRIIDWFIGTKSNVDFSVEHNCSFQIICQLKAIIKGYECLVLNCKDGLLSDEEVLNINCTIANYKNNILQWKKFNNIGVEELRMLYKIYHLKGRVKLYENKIMEAVEALWHYANFKVQYFFKVCSTR